MTEYVIRCVGRADGQPTPDAGRWLREFDPDTLHPTFGFGTFRWTSRVDKAMRFPSQGAAWDCYRMQSARYPVRPWDGRPDRPMTAYSIMCEPTPG